MVRYRQSSCIAVATIADGAIFQIQVEGKTSESNNAKASTLFDVASLTKTITTLVALKLVESNSLDLDEPLYNYWVDPDVARDTLHKRLTTRHVLAHRTGFKNWRWMNEDKTLGFDFAPGTKFQYSGEGFEYLRRSLERKFDNSLEKLADSLVFEPNKMNDSHLVWNEKIDAGNFAGTHDKEAKPYQYEKSFKANSADNLLTTIEDFSKLGVNIINKDYLNEEVYNEMIKPQSLVREGINFGLGWIVFDNLPNGEYALFNAGSDEGVNALIVLLPISKRGIVVMTNGDNGRRLAMKAIGEILGDAGNEILGRF